MTSVEKIVKEGIANEISRQNVNQFPGEEKGIVR